MSIKQFFNCTGIYVLDWCECFAEYGLYDHCSVCFNRPILLPNITEALKWPYKFSLRFIVELEATHWNIVASTSSRPIQTYGPFPYIETIFPGIDVPVIKRWSQPCPIFILGVPILVKSCLYMEKGPRECVNIKHGLTMIEIPFWRREAPIITGPDRTQVGPMLAPWTLLSGVPCKSLSILSLYVLIIFEDELPG